MWYNDYGDNMSTNKNNVISFVASPKTQEMMSEELNWCMRDKTPQYAKWQAKDGDTVITLYESGKAVFQGISADIDANIWIQFEKKLNPSKNVEYKEAGNKAKEHEKTIDKLDGITWNHIIDLVRTGGVPFTHGISRLQLDGAGSQ